MNRKRGSCEDIYFSFNQEIQKKEGIPVLFRTVEDKDSQSRAEPISGRGREVVSAVV